MLTALTYLQFLIALVVDVESDFTIMGKKKAIHHLRGALLFAPACLVAWVSIGDAWWVLHFVCLRFLLFDYMLNTRRGLDGLRYIGITSDKEPDALTDRLLERIGWKWGLVLKIGCAILSTVPL